jgi:hypothetical protein
MAVAWRRRLTMLLLVPRPRARRLGVLLSLGFLASVVVLFLGLLLFGSSRSFLVEARTDGLRLSFAEEGNIWRLPDAVLCLPLDRPADVPDPVCGLAARPDGTRRERLADWSDGTVVDVTRSPDGGLRVAIVAAGPSTPPEGAAFLLPAGAWRGAGALTFRGAVTIGQDMRTGARHFLREGRWEARESGPVTSMLRSVTEVVKAGTLATGSAVTVVIDGEPARVYGHLRPDDGAIGVTMISQLGDTALSIRHFGLSGPSLIRPDWIDVAITSPLLLALAALFSGVAAVGQVVTLGMGRTAQVKAAPAASTDRLAPAPVGPKGEADHGPEGRDPEPAPPSAAST